jgi:hypothetical protein
MRPVALFARPMKRPKPVTIARFLPEAGSVQRAT